MRDLRPDELSHVYGGGNTQGSGKGTEKATNRGQEKKSDQQTQKKCN